MNQIAKETIHADLEQEMRQSYLDYAMSVIVGRALPDVRDGLKPVHRRVLYAMSELGNDWNKAYKKSARIVGDVIGKYHPHGDTAVYDAIVRMAQDFSMRYPLIDGQGNFGSVDGDSPAAMRYTEIRIARIAHELLADIDKETVDFGPNYDETETQPLILPTRLPNLLINGSTGIAVGMATNVPPHNLTEVINGCLALIEDENMSTDALMMHIPGPDFPTQGIINGRKGILDAYRTGRGKIYVRARAEVETVEKTGRQSIIVTELPYQVNKARLLEKIAELVRNKKLEGISGLRDESDKSGMRMVIELKRGEVAEVIQNHLFRNTQMQTVFGINIVALINNQPKVFNLKELLEEFIRHRREIVTRRTIFEVRKARSRAHILEGLAVALSNIDEVIVLIKQSPNASEAKTKLLDRYWSPGVVLPMLERTGADSSRPEDLAGEFGLSDKGYRLSDTQAQAILELRLHRLTGLEQEKIHNEFKELLVQIEDLMDILNRSERLMQVIREELIEIRDRFGDDRKTQIEDSAIDLNDEDLIVEEDVVVTISHSGYAKSQPITDYRAQRRGGRGKTATKTKDEDFVSHMFVASTHDTVLCFSDSGQVYWLRVFQMPQAGRAARGKPLVNLLPLEENEKITAVLPIRGYDADSFIVMATQNGTVKKCQLTDFSRPRANGIRAIHLVEEDQLIGVSITDGSYDIMMFSDSGKAVRFSEEKVRTMGRTARGIRGINLGTEENAISLITVPGDVDEESITVLTSTQNGYGKRTALMEYPTKGRGGKGVISIQASRRNGKIVGAELVSEEDEVMLITDGGILIRTRVSEISVIGRNTQGVRLINMGDEESLISLGKIVEPTADNEAEEQDDTVH
jgi:DNA gyrase subunit A